MAQFTIAVDTSKAEAGVGALATGVGGLSQEFDALQASMRAAEAEMNQIAALQQQNLGFHDKAAQKAGPAEGFDWQAAQKKAMAGNDQDRDAAEGLRKQQEAIAANAKEFKLLGDNASKSGEALGGALQQLTMIANVAIVGATILAAYGAAFGALAANAIKFTQEKDAMRATFDAFTDGGGQKLLDELEDLAGALPFTADKVNAWGKSLLAAGIQGDALKTSIKAIAASAAIMQDGTGAAAEALIKRFAMAAETGDKITLNARIQKQLASAGVLAEDLAKALGVPVSKLSSLTIAADKLGDAMKNALINKGGKALDVLGQTWGSISAKLKEGFEDAFEDLGDLVGPFMHELQSLASEFYAGGIAGGTFKDMIKGLLTPAFEVARRSIRALHIAFLQVEIGFLKAKIAVKPLTSALDDLGVSTGVVNVAMYLIGGTAIVLAVVFGILAVAVLLAASPFIVFGVAVYLAYTGIKKLIAFLGEASDHMDNMKGAITGWADSIVQTINGLAARAPGALMGFVTSALSAGANFVLGLVQALMTGQGPVADAAKALALSAKNAVFGALGIASPSRVMLKAGRHTAEGFALGVEAGTDDVEAAAQGTADAATTGASSGGGGRGGAGGAVALTVKVEAGAVVINGAGGNVLELTEEALALLLEKVAARAGALRLVRA